MTDTSTPGPGTPGPGTPGPGTPGGGTAPAAPPGGLTTLPAEWPAKAADTVELLVAALNDKAVRPIVIAARGLVFGVLMLALTVALVVWLSVGLIRLMDVYFWPGEVWISYLLTGSIFTAGGLVAWHFRLAGDDRGAASGAGA